MKKSLLFLFLLASSSLSAQVADGFYRVKNVGTDRLLYIADDNGWAKLEGMALKHDLDAIILRKGLENAITDPSSILYVQREGSSNNYDLFSQGTSLKTMTSGKPIEILPQAGHFTVGATQSGFSANLGDVTSAGFGQYGRIGTTAKNNSNYWDALPVSSSSDNYFALQPSIEVNGVAYSAFYAAFGFSTASEGMHVYYVSKIDVNKSAVCAVELSGVIPNGTPVIVSSSSSDVSKNKLNLTNSNSSLSGNKLAGVYFNHSNQFLIDGAVPEATPATQSFYAIKSLHPHTNHKAYDPQTMRVLGKSSDGKLAFVKASLDYLPANQSYLVVPAGAPDCLVVLSESEFNSISSIDEVDFDSSANEIYNLLGKKINKNGSLPSGIYIINGKKTVVR